MCTKVLVVQDTLFVRRNHPAFWAGRRSCMLEVGTYSVIGRYK